MKNKLGLSKVLKRIPRKIYILSGILYLLFFISFLFSPFGPVQSSEVSDSTLRSLSLPFIIIGILPTMIAWELGSRFFCFYTHTNWDSLGHCNYLIIGILYHVASLFISLLPILLAFLIKVKK
jgi:hypothetical protein